MNQLNPKDTVMHRRHFLLSSGFAIAASGRARQAVRPDSAKLSRIGVMTLSFNSVLKSARAPDDPKRTLDILDVPQIMADRYGVHHVEFQHAHFASTEESYLRELRGRMRKARSRMNQICLEFGPLNISSPDPTLRLQTIDLAKQWIDHAVAVECPRVMLNQGTLEPQVRASAISALREINAYGKRRGVCVTLENRGHAPNPSQPGWETVVQVIREAGIHANPDTGNFIDEAARAAGLRQMYPLSCGSSHVHYEPARFNEANAIRLSKELGYKGLYSIEATSANGPDPFVAVQTIIDELLRDL